jgi:hypothetical protein
MRSAAGKSRNQDSRVRVGGGYVAKEGSGERKKDVSIRIRSDRSEEKEGDGIKDEDDERPNEQG